MADNTANPVSQGTSTGIGATLTNLLNKGLDAAAQYGVAKLQADAANKTAQAAAYRTDLAAANAAAAGTKTLPATASTLPKWVLPVGIGVGVLVVLGLGWKLLRGK